MQRALWAIATLLLVLNSGCHSSENLERQVKVLQEQLEVTKKENRELRSRLNSEEMKSLRDLQHQLDSYSERLEECRVNCDRLVGKAEEAGYYRGAADFNAALRVSGAPVSKGWWIFAEHYYTFQIQLKGQTLYAMTVETEEEMPSVLEGLSAMASISDALQFNSSYRH